MKVNLSLIALLMGITLAFSVSAQEKKFAVSLGLEGGLPLSSGLKASYGGAVGGSVKAQYNINEKISATLSGGALGFLPKNISDIASGSLDEDDSIDAMLSIPIKVGGKYFFADKIYAMLEIGTTSNRILNTGDEGVGLSPSYTAFVYAPGIGAQLGGFDIGVRYEVFSKNGSASFLGLRLGFNLFSIKK